MKKPHYPHFLYHVEIDLHSHGTAPQYKPLQLWAEVPAIAEAQTPCCTVQAFQTTRLDRQLFLLMHNSKALQQKKL